MRIQVTCACGHKLAIGSEDAGSVVHCPQCGRSLPALNALDGAPLPADVNPSVANDFQTLPVIQTQATSSRSADRQGDRNAGHVYLLAIAMVLVGLFSVVPVLSTVATLHREQLFVQLAPWAYAIIFAAMLHLVYVIYVVQLSDWSSVRVVSVLMLLHATVYAMLLGIRLLASPGNSVIRQLGLEATGFTLGQQAGWCLVMVLLYGTASYAAGYLAGRWQRDRARRGIRT